MKYFFIELHGGRTVPFMAPSTLTRAEIEQAVTKAQAQAERNRKPGDIDLDVYEAFVDILERDGICFGPLNEFCIPVSLNP